MNTLFMKQMQELLKDEFPAYEKSLSLPARRGFRVNTLKGDADHFFEVMDISHEKSPFCDNGYYTDAPGGIGYTPEYMAGAFYMQEPSASSAVTVLNPQKGMKVLDLCAAPGSKSTQIAEKLGNEGLLVTNEINQARCKVLLENIERHGSANTIVCNADTKFLAESFEGFFDAVLCDAPCSGEGMMRKEEEAEKQWSMDLIKSCAAIQREILDNAYRCLKQGGILVYSTCTLNKTENEYQIRQFLEKHPDMAVEDANAGFGRKGLIEDFDIDKCVRIFPMDGGEGHFVCRMRKNGIAETVKAAQLKSDVIHKETLHEVNALLKNPYPYYFMKQGKLYGGVNPFYDTGKARLIRNQVLIGEEKKGRFEFAHHFFMSSYTEIVNRFEMNDEQCRKYMHGEQIEGNVQKGWYQMCYHGYALGGAKSDGKNLKNKYPKAFRTR